MFVELVLRWMHVLSAVALLGGSFFMRWTLLPAMMSLTDDQRRALQQGVRQRWARVVGIASFLLLVSGLVNAVTAIRRDTFTGPYHLLLGIKLILGLAVFVLAALLSGRTAAAERMCARQTMWLNVTLALGAALVCLGGYMRTLH